MPPAISPPHGQRINNAPRLLPALIFACAPVGTAAGLIFAAVKLNRERAQIYRAAIKNPDAWRQLTGVWYASNRSPRITAAKKQELRTILTLKALYLDALY